MKFNLLELLIILIGSTIIIYDLVKGFRKKMMFPFLKGFLKRKDYKFRVRSTVFAPVKRNILNIVGSSEQLKRFCFSLFYGESSIMYGWFRIEYKQKVSSIERGFMYCLPNKNEDKYFLFPFKTDWLQSKKTVKTEFQNDYRIVDNIKGEIDPNFRSKIIVLLHEMESIDKPFLKFNNTNVFLGFRFSSNINEETISKHIDECLLFYEKIIEIICP